MTQKTSRRGFTLVEMMMVVSIISVIFAIASPSILMAREKTRSRACIRNLRTIDAAKEQYGLDNRLSSGSTMPALSVLCGAGTTTYIKGGGPVCAAGGAYTLNNLGTNPTCNIGTLAPVAHVMP